jgi:hypothetical protein
MSIELLETFDKFAGLRNALASLGDDRQQWAGIPMPLSDLELVIHPKYPLATELMAIGKEERESDDEDTLATFRNEFWSARWRTTVVVYEQHGKVRHFLAHPANQMSEMLSTLDASVAWGIEQEARALHLLATLVRHHTFKHYLMTGMFLERSERSGVTYLFRKLRPTVALKEQKGRMVILACLCGHPIAYYAGSWAGAMCPTDDVIAALAMMRGDEHLFWKRSNQHHPSRPQAGV